MKKQKHFTPEVVAKIKEIVTTDKLYREMAEELKEAGITKINGGEPDVSFVMNHRKKYIKSIGSLAQKAEMKVVPKAQPTINEDERSDVELTVSLISRIVLSTASRAKKLDMITRFI